MIGKTIVAAADESPEGRHAIQMAREIAEARATRWMVLTVTSLHSKGLIPAGRLVSFDPSGEASGGFGELARFVDWLGPETRPAQNHSPEVALAFGVPGIEITRFAALRAADLIVLGRRARTPDQRLILGETSDAVVRRSSVPVLFVPLRVKRLRKMVVALDGTDRAVAVLETALLMAEAVGAELAVLMVEPCLADEGASPTSTPMPRARTARWAEVLRRIPGRDGQALVVRRGHPVEEILAHVQANETDLLVIGYRRGGPPKVIGPTDIARNLLYAVPAAILTVPI